jgi:hypothetical protein
MSIDELYAGFDGRLVTGGGEAYVPLNAAPEFVGLCQRNDIVVLGIEAIFVLGDSTVPRLDMIADYSSVLDRPWQRAVIESTSSATAFLEILPDDPALHLAFTLRAASNSITEPPH